MAFKTTIDHQNCFELWSGGRQFQIIRLSSGLLVKREEGFIEQNIAVTECAQNCLKGPLEWRQKNPNLIRRALYRSLGKKYPWPRCYIFLAKMFKKCSLFKLKIINSFRERWTYPWPLVGSYEWRIVFLHFQEVIPTHFLFHNLSGSKYVSSYFFITFIVLHIFLPITVFKCQLHVHILCLWWYKQW